VRRDFRHLPTHSMIRREPQTISLSVIAIPDRRDKMPLGIKFHGALAGIGQLSKNLNN